LAAIPEQPSSPAIIRSKILDEAAPATLQLSSAPGIMRQADQQRTRAESAEPGTLLLRKPQADLTSVGTASPLPLAISRVNGNIPQISRQVESGMGAIDNRETSISGEASAEESAGTGEIDLEQLAEQVSRLLKSQLAVERERRGFGRWH